MYLLTHEVLIDFSCGALRIHTSIDQPKYDDTNKLVAGRELSYSKRWTHSL